MRHRNKKKRIKKGYDANRSAVRKLVYDFIRYGKLEITAKRAKILKTVIDQLVSKAKTRSEASKNVLLKTLGKNDLVERLYEIGSQFENRVGGFTKTVRLGSRLRDGAEIIRIQWTIEIAGTTKDKNNEPAVKPAMGKPKEAKAKKVNTKSTAKTKVTKKKL